MHIGLKSIGGAILSGYRAPRQRVLGVLIAFAVLVPAWAAWPQSANLTKNYQRGSTLYEAGMFEAATPYFARALALSEREYGPNSTRTGFILKNLATVYAKQRKFALAEPIFLRALAIFEEYLGANNGLVAELVSDLSIAYVEQKKFIQAEPLLGRVMKNLESAFGPDDPQVAVAAYNYGYASEFLGDAPKARELYARALRVWQSKGVPNDARIAAARGRIEGLRRVRAAKGPSLAPYLPKLLPGQPPAAAPASALARNKPLAAAGSARKTPETAEKSWHVQLASFRASKTAKRERERLRKSFEALLASAGGLKIVRARLPKGVFHRLGVGPLADRAAAGALCRALKARGQACIVVRR